MQSLNKYECEEENINYIGQLLLEKSFALKYKKNF